MELLPSLHSVKIAPPPDAFAGGLGLLVVPVAAGDVAVAALGRLPGPLDAGLAGAALPTVPAAVLCAYIIFLAPLSHDPTTLPAALAALSTTVTVKLATPAALIFDSICAFKSSQLLA